MTFSSRRRAIDTPKATNNSYIAMSLTTA